MYKAFYIQRQDHFGLGFHGFRNRLGLWNKSVTPLTSLIFFNVELARDFCDNHAKEGDYRYNPISLSEYDYFVAKCSEIYFNKHKLLPDILTINDLYRENGDPNKIILSADERKRLLLAVR